MFELEQRPASDPLQVVLILTGELDLTNVHELEERLESVSAGSSSLVLDLSRVGFVDSAALHVLFRAARELGREHFGLAVEPGSAIARTLEIVGMSAVATLDGSVDDVTTRLSSA